MESLISKIKEKKPLNRLDNDLVKYFINELFKREQKLKKKFMNNNLKKKDFETIVKAVRNELNLMYGQFWLADELSIESHKSTKERAKDYPYIYRKIFDITGKPKKILDLGCGLNPLSYKSLGDIYFISTEITDYDCEKLKDYFKKNKIKGEVLKMNLLEKNELPKADVCFMFKLIDSLEFKGHKIAERLIKEIYAKYIIVSFATSTTKGRKMNYPRRGWFEIMTKRLGYSFDKFETSNEIFYVLKKS